MVSEIVVVGETHRQEILLSCNGFVTEGRGGANSFGNNILCKVIAFINERFHFLKMVVFFEQENLA